MSIDDLTYRELKEMAWMFPHAPVLEKPHPFVGLYCIFRCKDAGVHAGELVSQTRDEAIVTNARRLWQWTVNDGIALSGLAVHGLKAGKVDTHVDNIALTGVIETIPCSPVAIRSINEFKHS